MADDQGLSARDLLKGTYNFLKYKLDCREIKLPRKAMCEIARDEDWHRTRIGYMGYESAVLLKISKQRYAMAFGEACGSYPAAPYDCDVAVVSVSPIRRSETLLAKEIHAALERGSHFRNSLIYAMADGQLVICEESQFGRTTLKVLKPRMKEFIAQELKTDPGLFHMDLRPVVASEVRYKPEFVPFLFDVFSGVLAA